MAINLRNNVQKQTLPLSNPIASFQNPVEDFLTPFQQTKKDLEGKIAEISSGQAPKSISQDINETNWSQFQGNNPNGPNYQPQSLIDYFRTGKTTSELMASGEIPSRKVPDSENPLKTPVKSSNPYDGAPQFVQDFGNFYMGTNPDDPTTSGLYQALAPNEEKIASMGKVVTDTAENLQNIGQDITATTGEVGNWIQNKAPGLEQAKGEGRYLSQDQVREFLDENKDLSEDQLVSAMADLEKEGFFFEGYNDENVEGQSTIGRDILGAGVKGIGSMFGMGSEALGGTMEGVGNIAEGETGLGVSQIAGQAPNVAMTAINTVAPGAGAVASTLFSTDSGQAVMEPVMEVSQNITEAGLNMTDLDPNSEEYQNYLKGGTGMLPLVATAGAAKGLKAYAPEIKGAMGRAGEFVQNKAPIVGEAIGKAGEKVSDAMGAVGQKFTKAKEKVNQMIDEDFLQIEQSKKAGFQSNPFQKEYAQGLVEQMKSPEGVADVKTVQTEYVSQLVDKLQPIIKLKEKALSEDSPIYKQIRELPTQIKIAPILEGFNATFKKNGLGIDDSGNIYRMPGTAGKTINQADIAKINQLYQDLLADSNAQGGNLSVGQVLDGRKNASKMAKYDASTTTDGTNVIRSMRKDIDTVAKDSIEGLREIDKNFVDKLESFENATRDLVYKQGEQRGDFISNFNSKIKNLKNDRNSPLRKRLDEIMPDISARIEAISNLSEIHGALTRNLIRGKFSQAVSGFSGGAFSGAVAGYQFGGILGAAGGFILGGILGSLADAKLTSFRQNRVIQIVSQTSKAGKARLNVINEKISKNEALSKADEKFLKDLKEKITRALVKEKIIPKESLKLLSGPSGLDLSAEVVNVNPIKAGPSQARQRLLGNTRRKAMSAVSEGINRPTGEVKTKPAEMYGKEAVDFKEKTEAYDKMVKNLKDEIASNTRAARYNGTGNERVESAIKTALDTGKIDMPTAFDIVTEIIDDTTKGKTDKTHREKYSYIDAPKLDKFLNDLYSGKVEKGPTFDDLINQKSSTYEAPKKETTPYQVYDEINRMANDRRYNHETTNAKIAEFQNMTGKSPIDVSYEDFSAEGMLKTGEKVVQKQEGTTAVIEKPQTEVKVEQKPEAKRLLPKQKAEEVAKKAEQQSLIIEEKPSQKEDMTQDNVTEFRYKMQNKARKLSSMAERQLFEQSNEIKGKQMTRSFGEINMEMTEGMGFIAKKGEKVVGLFDNPSKAKSFLKSEQGSATKRNAKSDYETEQMLKYADEQARKFDEQMKSQKEIIPKPKQLLPNRIKDNIVKKPEGVKSEISKLSEEAKSIGKYDNSYDVTKGKKLYRGGDENGAFWTDDIEIAKSYGDAGATEKTVTMKNPLDVRSQKIKDYIKKNSDINIDDATSAYSRSLPEFKKLMKWAEENGYDGIIGKTSDNGLNYVGNEFVILNPSPKPLIKKPEGVKSEKIKMESFDEDTRKAIFVYQPKGYNVPKAPTIYQSESGIGVSYKGKGRVDFFISNKDGKIKVSTDGLGGNAIDFIQDAWKKVGPEMEKKLNPSPKPLIKPEGVKNLTPTKESGKIGGMEDTKLIEPKFTREQATKYMEDNIQRIMKEVRLGKLTKEEGKTAMLELQNDMKYIRLGITPEKLKAGKENLIEGVVQEMTKTPVVKPKKIKILSKGEEAIKSLQAEKKKIQGQKNAIGQYSRADRFRLIQIDDAIREYKRTLNR